MQRLRLKFSRGKEVKFLSHLDMLRLWERALRRASLPLAYSQGFNPHPRISLAAPLSVGTTSQEELADIFLYHWISPNSLTALIKQQLPRDIDLIEAWTVGLNIPSLQSQVRFAEYTLEIETEKTSRDIELALQSLLSTKEISWHHSRNKEIRHYNLRALVDNLWLIACSNSLCTLGMRLSCAPNGAGRPEQVTLALGFEQRPKSIHRTKLILT